jgi:hypothetical protein
MASVAPLRGAGGTMVMVLQPVKRGSGPSAVRTLRTPAADGTVCLPLAAEVPTRCTPF